MFEDYVGVLLLFFLAKKDPGLLSEDACALNVRIDAQTGFLGVFGPETAT